MKLSIIIVSFQSEHLLKKLLVNFPKKYQVIIVDNSKLKSTKNKIEKKFRNTKVIIPKENLGYAKAFNLALKNCKNDIILTLTPDVLINKNLILNIEKFLTNFKNFTLIAPEYKNQNIYKNYIPFRNGKLYKNIKTNYKFNYFFNLAFKEFFFKKNYHLTGTNIQKGLI